MDLDDRLLADPIEAPDALLEQLGFERQVKQHKMMGELKVPALATNLGTDEQAGASLLAGLGKPGRVAIPLDQAQSLVKDRGGGARCQAYAGTTQASGVERLFDFLVNQAGVLRAFGVAGSVVVVAPELAQFLSIGLRYLFH